MFIKLPFEKIDRSATLNREKFGFAQKCLACLVFVFNLWKLFA
jgi:hypothetical protein